MQKKTFSAWINRKLEKCGSGRRVTDLYYDLRDGHVLLSLLETLTGSHMARETGGLRVHHLANTAAVLGCLQRQRVAVPGINNVAVVDGHPAMTLDLVWAIILHWQFHQTLVDSSLPPGLANSNVEKILLAWCRQSLSSSPLPDHAPLRNFTTDWADGLAFAGVLLAHSPNIVGPETVLDKAPEPRLGLVFRLAESHLGIPCLLEPADLCRGAVDRKCVLLYVMCLFAALPHDEVTEESLLDVSLASDPGFRVNVDGSPAKTPVTLNNSWYFVISTIQQRDPVR